MAESISCRDADNLVVQARTDAVALGQLYEMFYERIFRFCVHRLFSKEASEDVTSMVFLEVARRIRAFAGNTLRDFESWLYAIAANQANAYIRKSSRRKRILIETAGAMQAATGKGNEDFSSLDWPTLYQAILKLKPEHQTIVVLRFFENMEFEQIGRIMDAKEGTIRVTLHRILDKLQRYLTSSFGGETENA